MKDNLSRTIYAEKIADEISDHYQAQKDGKESENMVFAISGKWGEGKTKLLDLLEPKLMEKGFTVIRFNPWQYSQEDVSLKRSFLRTVKDKLGSGENLDDLYFDRSKTVINWKPVLQTILKVVLAGGFLLYLVMPTLLGITIYEWWNTVNFTLKNFWGSGVGGVVFTALVLPLLIKTIVVSSRKAQVTTAEEFDVKFKQLLKGNEKIVIFIDDLDRCTSSTVKLVLDSLRTFFHNPECSYVITGDHTVIERYAAEELNPKKEQLTGKDMEEGRRFLKKLFDVYWRLPLATPRVFGGFVSEEIIKSGITLNDKQDKNIKVFLLDDRLFERNPRHVKRFITALKFALQSVSLQSQELDNNNSTEKDADIKEQKISIKEILDNVDLLAKVLLIQEKFYPIYEKLVLYPADIVNHEKTLRGGGNPETLTIDGKNVFKDILESDAETLKNYIGLVNLEPQFTNADNGTIFDPTNFFSFSAATGLPSLKGPDETNFPQYLKSGQLGDRLGASLETSPVDKRTRLAQRALQVFDESVDTEKMSVVSESLKMAARLDEWALQLDQWKHKLLLLPPDQQNALADEWWRAVLIKSPNMLAIIKGKNPDYFETLWSTLTQIDKNLLHKDSFSELEKILKDGLVARPPVLLNGTEIVFNKFSETSLKKDLEEQLVDPATFKVFLDILQALGLQGGQVYEFVKIKLKNFLDDITHIDWLIANKEYLKPLGLFDPVKINVREWAKDLKYLTQIADRKDTLELNEEDKKIIGDEIVGLVKKSSNLNFLDNPNVQHFLTKEHRKEIFAGLKVVLNGKDDSLGKRQQAAEFLVKTKSIWTDVQSDDVYDFLKEINKFKFNKTSELQYKPKEIVDSWGFNDSLEKKE